MAMFHTTYLKKKGFINWDELGCLSRALGFPRDTLLNSTPEEIVKEQDGLSFKELERLCNQKYFHKVLDRTFNHHTDDWNLCVIKKAVRLLSHKVLSFADLHNVRVAYQTYEAADTKGMTIDQRTLLRSLKMCNRTIAPLKMMHRIKHMRENFDEPVRIQLYEYLDLILWCDLYEKLKLDDPVLVSGKDERDLFKLDNFAILLSHHDQRLALYLNQKYLEDEWNFGNDEEEEETSQKLAKEPPVKTGVRTKQVLYHKRRYTHLRAEVDHSEKRVTHVQAGYVRDRPISAPDLVMYSTTEQVARSSTKEANPEMVCYSSIGEYMSKKMTRKTAKEVPLECPRPTLTAYQRPKNEDIVTNKEFIERGNLTESLYFEMETLGEKYHQMIEDDMEYIKPGFRERLAQRPKPVPPSPLAEPKPKVQPRPTPEFLNYIGYPQRKSPLPTHAKKCDARFRGWYDVPHKKGHHFVLASPAFADSYKGRLFKRLQDKANEELSRPFNNYIYRYTPRNQVVKEVRPATAPEIHPVSPERGERNEKKQKGGAAGKLDALTEIRISTGVLSMKAESDASSLSFTDFKMYKECPPEVVYENVDEKIVDGARERDGKVSEKFLETKDARESTPWSPQKDRRTPAAAQTDLRTDLREVHGGEENVMYKRDAKGDVLEKMVSHVGDHGRVDRLEIFAPKTDFFKAKDAEASKVGRVSLLENIIESTETLETSEKAKGKLEHPSERKRRIAASRNVSPTIMSSGHEGEAAESYIKQASHYLRMIAPKKYVKPKEHKKKSTESTTLQENKPEIGSKGKKLAENKPKSMPHSTENRKSAPAVKVSDEDIPTSLRAAQILTEVENREPKPTSYPVDPAKSYKRLLKRLEGDIRSDVKSGISRSFTSPQNEALLGCA